MVPAPWPSANVAPLAFDRFTRNTSSLSRLRSPLTVTADRPGCPARRNRQRSGSGVVIAPRDGGAVGSAIGHGNGAAGHRRDCQQEGRGPRAGGAFRDRHVADRHRRRRRRALAWRQQHRVVMSLRVERGCRNLARVVDGIRKRDVKPRSRRNQGIQVRDDAVHVDPAVPLREAPGGPHRAHDDASVVDIAGVRVRARNGQRRHHASGVDERLIERLVRIRIGAARGADNLAEVVDGRGAPVLVAGKQAEVRHHAALPHERMRHDPRRCRTSPRPHPCR